jgi:hypothetical protein
MLDDCLTVVAALILTPLLAVILGLLVTVALVPILEEKLFGLKIRLRRLYRTI